MARRFVFAITLGSIVLGLVLSARPSLAGYKSVYFANISTTARYAYGQIGGTRGSPDGTEFMGCYFSSTPGAPTIVCQAMSSTGVYGSCTSTDWALQEAVMSITANAYLYFAWDVNGNCTSVYVETRSDNYPVLP